MGAITPNIIEANTSRVMMSVAGEKILLADSSKFGRRSLGLISKVNALDLIITTKELSTNEVKIFSDNNVQVSKV